MSVNWGLIFLCRPIAEQYPSDKKKKENKENKQLDNDEQTKFPPLKILAATE